MRILITNDDGINSQGIFALAREFINEGEVIISAPDRQRSASSHSITMGNPITVKEHDFHGMDIKAYAVSGTPADCVKLALEKLIDGEVDAVVSGINDGANLGTDVLYSGTVSAAIEAALLDIPSMAVSQVMRTVKQDYSTAAYYARKIFKKMIGEDFKKGTVLNVNVPYCSREEIKGIMATGLGTVRYTNSYKEGFSPNGNRTYTLAGEIIKTDNGSTTDIYAVENKYISITPMHYELTKYDYIDSISEWKLKL